MVKSVLGVNHQGLRDWVIQRISAIIIALASVGFIGYLMSHPGVGFFEWHSLFASMGMKVFTLIVILALAFHAWIGVWTVVTDYVKPAMLRFAVNIAVFMTLLACVIWALLMMWSL
ncbi:MAG TPA: succinate dehydrogenase, hydrophobic membrane anchor protein [Gammaproteobacteria bacterium]|nr:succinate dehydrogenase, hydrophobic membrane anchor protein [Gammaproteobacteria bacterium]